MRAIVHQSFGEPADVLTVEEVATPEPKAGEVRLRILLATIHNHDLMTVRGVYGFKPELPARSGTEAVGVVDAVGEGVENLEVGQRVVASTFGVWAEFVTLPANGLSPLDESIPDEVAAQLFAMPFSAITLLDFLNLEPGDWVVQNAANGAVGRVFARLAATRDINVVGLVRRADSVTELASEGIDRVVATDDDSWRDRVAELTGGAPIKAGIESIGGQAAGDLASLLGQGGVLVIFGAMASGRLDIASSDILFKEVTVKGFWGSKVGPALSPERRTALVGELRARIADGTVSLPVASIHSFDDVADAARASDTPGRVGKVLLRP
ncbi:zinc-binding dehydrogenase [Microbacterium sp. P06]|uniref:zinc-binding dehydrogenase n=1 Tax=Microbacterium sp. P06 TaxID=3366949 RepID=UPI003745D67E